MSISAQGKRKKSLALSKLPKVSKLSKSPKSRQSSRHQIRPKARLFKQISELYTLEGISKKQGRGSQLADLGRLDRAAILERDGQILWIGNEAQIPKEIRNNYTIEEVSCGGRVVLPGFVECHTHLIFAGNRAREFERRNQGATYQEIAREGGGIFSSVNATRATTPAKLLQSAQTRTDRFIAQGITTLEVKSGYGLDLENEVKMLRVAGKLQGPRVVRTFLGAHAISKDREKNEPQSFTASSYLDWLLCDVLPVIKQKKLASRVDIFLEQGYFPAEIAEVYLRGAKTLGFEVVVHADQLTRSLGAQTAVNLAAISADHLININQSDIQALAKSEVTAVLLPTADLYMNCAYPPARKLIDAGARVALATDFNPGTSPSQDLALVGVLARVMMKMSLAETISAYTVGAAHALNQQGLVGSLEMGKASDFILLDGSLDELFLEVGRMPIASVYRAGQVIYEQP
jgi:imidazolonepropionase